MSRFRASLAQNPIAYLDNQTGFLGQRNDLVRRDHAACGMVPAEEGLKPRYPPSGNVEQRLIIDLELAGLKRPPQIHFQQTPRLKTEIHVRFEESERSSALRLGPIEGQVGVLQQLVAVEAIRRRHSHPNARADHDLVIVNPMRNGHALNQALRQVT